MSTTKDRIEVIRQQGYELDFGETFNHTFEIYKKIAINAGLVFLLLAIVATGILLGVAGAVVGFSALPEQMAGFNPANLSPLYVVTYIFGAAILSSLFSPTVAGILKMSRQADLNEPFSMGTAFDYYSSTYFKELFLAAFLLSMASVGISTLLEVLSIPFLGAVISIVLSFLTFLTIPSIIFGDLKAVEAIRASIIVVSKNPLLIIGLMIVTFLASLVGLIVLCIGYFFTVPILYVLYYTIYLRSVGMDQTNEIDQIGFRSDEL